MKSDKNPDGVPKEVVDSIREGTAQRRSQFYKDITVPFYGYNRPARGSPSASRRTGGGEA